MDQQPIIEFTNFSFQYFSQAEPTLHDINLKIYPGQKILIVGPSGSGKSTLGHCLNGLIPFSYQGEITGQPEDQRGGNFQHSISFNYRRRSAPFCRIPMASLSG